MVFTPLSTEQKMINKEKENECVFLWGEILDVIYFYVNIPENLNRHKQSNIPPHPPHKSIHHRQV